jgi:broad specificity phosphatase PhoE
MYEGRPRTKALQKEFEMLMRVNPSYVIPGRHELSTENGESFNQFKARVGNFVSKQMKRLKEDPTRVIFNFTHQTPTVFVKAWTKAGNPRNFAVDLDVMTAPNKDIEPGSMWCLWLDGEAWKFSKVDLKAKAEFLPGIYFVRHGDTEWN